MFCLYINRTNNELAIPSLATRNVWSMNEAHERLGHANKDAAREMVKGLNLSVIPRNMGICWACTVAKAKQKNMVQFSMHERSSVPGERVFVDISSIKPPKGVPAIPRANWRIVVDECTSFKNPNFFRKRISWLKLLVNY